MVKEQLLKLNEYRKDKTDTVSDCVNLTLISCDDEAGKYTMRCHTTKWMCNISGVIHGGMISTIVDQAMGVVSYCSKACKGFTPTVEMNVNFLRPLLPEEDILIDVKLLSSGRQMIHTACEVFRASEPNKVCVTATAVYFHKNTEV